MLEMRSICKSFGARRVLDNLSLSLAAGEVLGLLGPNGAGKSTTINILCGLLQSDAGAVTVQGKPVSEETRQRIGVVPQEVSLYRDLTCRENLHFFASLYGLKGAERDRRVEALITMFSLGEYAGTEIAKLSGGWQRRVNIAAGLVHQPGLLILDEPTAGLDIEARYELWQLIAALRDTGMTILLTTHQLEEAERLCSRIAILHDGRILAEGPLAALCEVVPAAQLAVVEAADTSTVRKRAQELGWAQRTYGGRLTLLLPARLALREVVDALDGVPLTSVSLHDVGLEHAYLELTCTVPAAAG